mmetsp:Transcript_28024/g.90348  ORF Transcript_28024/g.90348 Transcript_28024/m.90348 type:complete len:90 (-) Transcript_28024:37-306(-)
MRRDVPTTPRCDRSSCSLTFTVSMGRHMASANTQLTDVHPSRSASSTPPNVLGDSTITSNQSITQQVAPQGHAIVFCFSPTKETKAQFG